MADLDDIKDGKDWDLGTPAKNQPFFLKGSEGLDWGMKSRLTRIFNPASGRTVMLAFDHGYFQGPTTGLERIDLSIVPLAPYADVLMCTRGILRSSVPAQSGKPVVLRCSGGNSILSELSNELVAVDIEDAIRLDAAAMAAQIYIGAEYEHQSIGNLIKLIDCGNRYGMPVSLPHVDRYLFGTPDDCLETIAAYRAAGVTEFVLNTVRPVPDVVAEVEKFAELVLPRID